MRIAVVEIVESHFRCVLFHRTQKGVNTFLFLAFFSEMWHFGFKRHVEI